MNRRLVHVSVEAGEPRRTAPLVAEHAAVVDACRIATGARASALLRAPHRRCGAAGRGTHFSRAAIVA